MRLNYLYNYCEVGKTGKIHVKRQILRSGTMSSYDWPSASERYDPRQWIPRFHPSHRRVCVHHRRCRQLGQTPRPGRSPHDDPHHTSPAPPIIAGAIPALIVLLALMVWHRSHKARQASEAPVLDTKCPVCGQNGFIHEKSVLSEQR